MNDCRSTGYHGVQRYKLHFVMQFDKPFKTMNGWIRNKVYSQIEQLHKSNMKSRQVFTVENNSQDKLAQESSSTLTLTLVMMLW